MSDSCYSGLVSGDRPLPLTVPALQLLAQGEPVALSRLADAAGWPLDRVEEVLRGFPGVDWDEQGRLVGLGLTLRPTPHRFSIDGRTLYTWCAVDTLLFTVILGRPAVAESTCAATRRPVVVRVAPERIVDVDPATAVISEVRRSGCLEDIRATMCDHGHFFVSREAATDWMTAHPDGSVTPVADCFADIRKWAASFGWTRAENPA